MDDKSIIKLFYERSETAISKVDEKYGKYCNYIAYNILKDKQDSEECVNDTYLKAWNTIPPSNPKNLSTFLGKITRNLALDKYKYYNREKRGRCKTMIALDELEECIPTIMDTEQIISDKMLANELNLFLAGLQADKRKIFIRRYWYFSSISEIARDYSISESNVKVVLYRTRQELKVFLERKGIVL